MHWHPDTRPTQSTGRAAHTGVHAPEIGGMPEIARAPSNPRNDASLISIQVNASLK
ncbi:protein of unknown function [Burkholderia multivorans]